MRKGKENRIFASFLSIVPYFSVILASYLTLSLLHSVSFMFSSLFPEPIPLTCKSGALKHLHVEYGTNLD